MTPVFDFLPQLVFNLDEQLTCHSINAVARTVFNLNPLSTSLLNLTAEWFFRRNDTSAEPISFEAVGYNSEELTVRWQLDELARASVGRTWEAGVPLMYYVTDDNAVRTIHFCEAIVQPFTYDIVEDDSLGTSSSSSTSKTIEMISITFLRPLESTIEPPRSSPTSASPSVALRAPFFTGLPQHPVESDAPALPDDQLFSFIQNLPCIAFATDQFGRTFFFNESWFTFTGLSIKDSLDPVLCMEMFHPDEREAVLTSLAHSYSTSTKINLEYRLLICGKWRSVLTRGNPMRDPSGSITAWVCTITCVDELVQARADALQVKERISATLIAANLIIYSVDRNSIIDLFEGVVDAGNSISNALMNDRPCEKQNRIGSKLIDAWPDALLQHAVTSMLNDTSIQSPRHVEFDSHGLKQGLLTRSYRYRLVPVRGDATDQEVPNTGVLIVAMDITSVVASASALKAANLDRAKALASETAAKEASRLKTEFVTNMSHEIRTPIACIIGIAELLLSDILLVEEHRKLVLSSLKTALLLLDLVGTVLDLGKVEAGKLEIERTPFLLLDAISDSSLFRLPAQSKGITFVEEVDPACYTGLLLGDQLRLRQVIANLLSNAVKFTKQGQITFRVVMESETELRALFEFTVIDTGVGISPSVIPALFAPFHQADTSTAREYGGSGIGLHLSRKLVESMNGIISLSSVFGQGTTLTVRLSFDKFGPTPPELPLGSSPAQSSPPTSCDSSPTLSFSERSAGRSSASKFFQRNAKDVSILLAEDNALIREIVKRTLTKLKFHVRAVCDGSEALEALSQDHYDLVLMDGQMPRLDGYQATREIRRSKIASIQSVKIIALTASAIVGDRERCIDSGMDAYLAKPVRTNDLVAAIWTVLSS